MKRMIFFGVLALVSITLAAAADAEYFARNGHVRTAFVDQISTLGKNIGNGAKALIGKGPAPTPAATATASPAYAAAETHVGGPALLPPALTSTNEAVAFQANDMPAPQILADQQGPLSDTGFTQAPQISEATLARSAAARKAKAREIDAADGEPTDIPGPALTLLFAIATIALMRRFA